MHHALWLRTGLQKRFERHGAYEMFQELKLVFQTHARVERYETSHKYFAYKMEEYSSAREHVLRMSGYYNSSASEHVLRMSRHYHQATRTS